MALNAAISLGVAGAGRVLPAGATVAVMTLTATRASSPTGLTAWPTGAKMPAVSDVCAGPGRTTANLTAVKIGTGGVVSILNRDGSTHVVADIVGYYRPAKAAAGVPPHQGPPRGPARRSSPATPPAPTRPSSVPRFEGGNPATLEAQTGRKLSLHRSYMDASTSTAAMAARAKADVATGRIPLISTKVPGSWAAVAAGQQDAWLLERIRGLAAVDGPVWLALHHEPAGDGAPADWVAMQQHARTLIKANSSNIALVGILNGWDFKKKNGNPVEYNMPVGTGVDIMGFDSYNGWSPTNGKAWQPAADVFSPALTIQSWGYPTLVGEYGVRTDPANPGRAAQWLRDAYAFATAHHFVGMSYFDSGLNSPDGTWTLDTERLLVFRTNLNALQTAPGSGAGPPAEFGPSRPRMSLPDSGRGGFAPASAREILGRCGLPAGWRSRMHDSPSSSPTPEVSSWASGTPSRFTTGWELGICRGDHADQRCHAPLTVPGHQAT